MSQEDDNELTDPISPSVEEKYTTISENPYAQEKKNNDKNLAESQLPYLHIPPMAPRALDTESLTENSVRFMLWGGYLILAGVLVWYAPLLLERVECGAIAVVGLLLWTVLGKQVVRDTSLMKYGILVYGEITNRTKNEVEYVYYDLAGRKHTKQDYLEFGRRKYLWPEGLRVAVMLDPRNPSRAVLPAAMDAPNYAEQEEAPDTRPREPANTYQTLETNAPSSTQSQRQEPLYWSLSPCRLGFVRTMFAVGSYVKLGHISWDSQQLSIHLEQENRRLNLSWEEPFQVSLAVSLLDENTALLHITLRPQGKGRDHWLQFQTQWPQSQLSQNIPRKQEAFASLKPESFALLWENIVFHASLHGQDLRRHIGRQQPPSKTSGPTLPQSHTKQTQRTTHTTNA